MLFATIGVATPVWLIVVLSFAYGFFQLLQFTSMNTLFYADVSAEAAGSASTIASTAVFGGLKPADGSAVSQHRADQHRADLSATES